MSSSFPFVYETDLLSIRTDEGHPDVDSIVCFLKSVYDDEYCLTGSRFFGNFREDSDVDIFTQYLPEKYQAFLRAGFANGNDYFCDEFITHVLEKPETAPGHYVQIQFVKSYDHKYRVQNALKRMGAFPDLYVWNFAMSLSKKQLVMFPRVIINLINASFSSMRLESSTE